MRDMQTHAPKVSEIVQEELNYLINETSAFPFAEIKLLSAEWVKDSV